MSGSACGLCKHPRAPRYCHLRRYASNPHHTSECNWYIRAFPDADTKHLPEEERVAIYEPYRILPWEVREGWDDLKGRPGWPPNHQWPLGTPLEKQFVNENVGPAEPEEKEDW